MRVQRRIRCLETEWEGSGIVKSKEEKSNGSNEDYQNNLPLCKTTFSREDDNKNKKIIFSLLTQLSN